MLIIMKDTKYTKTVFFSLESERILIQASLGEIHIKVTLSVKNNLL